MDIKQINQTLARIFKEENKRIIDCFDKDFSLIQNAIKKRLDGYWTNIVFDDEPEKNLYNISQRIKPWIIPFRTSGDSR
jgi:hypothetical protein